MENTYHVQRSTPFDIAGLTAVANAFDAWDATALGGILLRSNTCALFAIKTRALDSQTAPIYVKTLATPRNGSSAGAVLPAMCTFCVKLETGHAGRSQRGRVYLPGLNAAMQQTSPNGDFVSATYANQCVTALNALIAAIAAIGASYALVVTSTYSGGAWRTTGVNTAIINATYADLRIDSQRRRMR